MAKSSPYRGVTLFRPTGKWRAQISAVGKTVSLGDHDTEEEAAHAFDRAAINKGGTAAKTNFPMSEYETEVTELTGLSQEDLVAMLRNRARKSTSHTSNYRGVSLLKQTGKWHAQINVGGKQVHLGFFLSEMLAAKAYDRAAINKSLHEGHKVATNFDMSTYRDEMKVLTAMNQDDFVAALADEERRKGLMDMLAQGFTLSGAQAVFGSSFMQPPGGKGFSTQAKATRAHRELQALQRDGSASLSVSTGKVSTRKRKLADSHLDAAAVAAAAATTPAAAANAPDAAQAASVADDQSVNVLPASHPIHVGGQVASYNKHNGQAAVRSRRRASQRNARTFGDKQVATTESALVTRASEERHRDGSMEAPKPPATAVASGGASADVDKHPGMVLGHPHLLEGQDQAEAKAAAVQPTAGKTRLQRGVAQLSGALIKVEDTSAPEAHAQERVPAGHSGPDGKVAESERDRRLSARQMRSTGSKVKVIKDLPVATPFLSAEAQQAGQSSLGAPAAKELLPAAASAAAATGKAPKRAKHAKAPEAAAAKSYRAPPEATGSQQETASGSAEKPIQAVQATPAVASAAAKADALPQSNGVSAARSSSRKGAVSAGVAGSKTQPSAAATTVVAGTVVQPTAAADTGMPARQPPAAPAATPSLLSAQVGSKAAQTSAAGRPVSQQGVPGPAAAGAASFQVHQPAGAAGKQIASAAGPVPHGPGEADRPAGPFLHNINLPAATAPAEANVSQAAQQEGSKPASTSQEVGKSTLASSPGKPHQVTVPAKTGVVWAPAVSVHQQVQDVAILGAEFNPESSPTFVTDVKDSQQPDAQLASLSTPSNTPTEPHTLPSSTTHATPPTDPGLKPSQALHPPVSSSPRAKQPASQELQSLPTSKAALTGSSGQQAINGMSQVAVSGIAAPGVAVFGMAASGAAVPKIGTHRGTSLLSSGSQGYPSPPVWVDKSSLIRPALDTGNANPGSASSTKPQAAVPGFSNGKCSGLPSGGLATAVGRRPEAANASAGLVLPTKSMTASSAIAAAARANAAAANAIAESGSSLGCSSTGFAHDDGRHASAGAMHPIPTASGPAGQLPTAPAASKARAVPVGMTGTSSARAGSSGAELHQTLPASQAASQAMFLSQQQQQLNGVAMMTAMHQSCSGMTCAQGSTQAVASASAPTAAQAGPLWLSNPSMPAPPQQIADSPRYGSMQGSQPFLNPNFNLPSAPAPFRNSSNPSSRAGIPANPSYVPSSSATNPNTLPGFAAGSNPMYARSSTPLAPGSHFSGPALSTSVPKPSSSKSLGPQPSGNPLSPSYRPQGLHATAPETGIAYQSLGQGNSQIPWPHAKPPYRGAPSQAQPNPHAHSSLPAGAQVTPATSRAQQSPQLAAQASMAMEMQALQSHGLTNAHAIVPGMLPSSLPRGSNTAWQVGLAAGLAATANLRAPNPSVGHQAATTAAAARAAAAFQASRAMAKSQQSPLLQQGSVNAGAPAATDGSSLAGPSTTPSSGFTLPASAAISNRPLITSGIDTTFGASAKAAESAPGFGTVTLAAASSTAPPAASGAPPPAAAVATTVSAGGHLQGSHSRTASHQAFARQGLRASLPTGVATSANPPSHIPSGAGLTAPAPISTALPDRPVPQPEVATSYSAAGPTAYSAEAQALYRARAQPRPYAAQSQAQSPLPQSQYVSLSQPPYNVQTHTPYIAPSQLPYVAQSQSGYKPQLQPPPTYSAQSQAQYSTAAMAQQRYAATAAQSYAAAAPQLAQPRPALRPPLNVEHFAFAKLAPQPKNAIDIIAEDAVLPTFPLKKRKPKKRKFAGLEVFAAEVYRHKSLMQESKRNVLQCQFVKKSPIGRPPKDFRPRPSAARQAEQQLAKATSVTSLAPKPKGKAAKGTKGKAAAAKGRKGTPKKGNRVVWDSIPQKRRSGECGPIAGRQFAGAARLHQEHTGNTGMDQLLGALGPELEAHEAEEGSDSDDDAVSGTNAGAPHRALASSQGREGVSVKRGRGSKTVARASSAAARGRGRGRGSKEALTGRGGKGHKRAASSSPDRGPIRHNRRKTQAPSRAS